MDTIDMNTNGCYVEHELWIVDEYGEEVACSGWHAQLTRTGTNAAALCMLQANDPRYPAFPASDLPGIAVDTTTFPQCP
jgi:hypothetical protein